MATKFASKTSDRISIFDHIFAVKSCDVGRSFSMYKHFMTDRRTSMTEENIEMHLICNCFKKWCVTDDLMLRLNFRLISLH